LCGARNQVDQLLAVISEAKLTLPEALSLYWMGRCLTKEGEIAQAQAAFEKALTKTDVPILRKRIQYALDQTNLDSEIVHKGSVAFTVDDCKAEMKDIWSHFQRGAFIQEILAPRRRSPVVNGLLFINLAVFLLADPHFKMAPALALSIFSSGMLSDAVIKHGEYYRLLTYMFLHTTVIHLGVNMLGLLALVALREYFWYQSLSCHLFFRRRSLWGSSSSAASG
jgi:hypothetical protein